MGGMKMSNRGFQESKSKTHGSKSKVRFDKGKETMAITRPNA
jgi:hypothetical protein